MNYGRLCALIHRMYAVYIISALKILLPERQGKNNNGFIKILLLNIWTMFAQGRKENVLNKLKEKYNVEILRYLSVSIKPTVYHVKAFCER